MHFKKLYLNFFQTKSRASIDHFIIHTLDAEIHKLIDEVHPHYLTIPGIEPGINNSGTESYDGRMVNHGSSQLHETCEVNQLILTNTNETCEQLNLTSYVEFCFLFRVRDRPWYGIPRFLSGSAWIRTLDPRLRAPENSRHCSDTV